MADVGYMSHIADDDTRAGVVVFVTVLIVIAWKILRWPWL